MDHRSHGCVAGGGRGHLVEFYESEAVLAGSVADFIGEALLGGGSAVIVATEAHRDAFVAAMGERGVDVEQALLTSRLIVLDARETLAKFMARGGPDRARFRDAITVVMDRARRGSQPLRVYGEMVAALWADGEVASALALEDLWNDLAAEREFGLLCAYPMSAFDDPRDAAAFARVCEQHTGVTPSEGYAGLADRDHAQRGRADAGLQREVRLLRGRIEGTGTGERAVARQRPGSGMTPAAPASRRSSDEAEPELARRLGLAVREGDATGASAVLENGLRLGVSATALLARVVPAAMHAIGAAWERGEITVADEHLATITCQRAITWLYPSLLTHRPRSRERVLVAGVEGEAHELAPRVVADVLEGRGYDVIHLGVDVPADALADAVIRHTPELIALSLTMPSGFSALERSIAAAQGARSDILILLGGQGVAPRWAEAGFPVGDDAEHAARLVEALLRERLAMPTGPRTALEWMRTPATGRNPLEHVVDVATELSVLARENALRAHEYRFLALEDPLTGLPNRRAFENHLCQVTDSGAQAALMLLDIDNFKQINDAYGHNAGDTLLEAVGQAIGRELRAADTVARLGGDEFGILLVHTADLDLTALAERIRYAVQRRCASRAATVSIGVAVCDGDSAEALLRADRALYAAKTEGRNTVRHAPFAEAPGPLSTI